MRLTQNFSNATLSRPQTLTVLLLLAVSLATLAACGENSKGTPVPADSKPTDVATHDVITGERESIPSARACLRTMPRTGNWEYYRRNGFRRYNIGSYVWNNRSRNSHRWPSPYIDTLGNEGFCGCGPGYQPVCDPYNGGMTCMRVANYALVTWSWQGSEFRVTSTWSSRRGGHLTSPPMSNGCYAHVAQSCVVGFDETCAIGICEPTGMNPPIGVCVRGRR